MSQIFHSPAKINLNLEINNNQQRTDGYHEINTLIAPINLYDQLSFNPAQHYQLSYTNTPQQLSPTECPTANNLITKALKLWEQATGITANYHIQVSKHIPHGAGLGGGSSNAITTLKALNQLNHNPLTPPQLLELANQLGSDMACFMHKGITQCTGRGDISQPYNLDNAPLTAPQKQQIKQPLLLIKPQFGVNSGEAYQLYKQYHKNSQTTSDPTNSKNATNTTNHPHQLKNDLEPPVFKKYPFLEILKNWLKQQPETTQTLMTGSGSTIVAYLKDTTHTADTEQQDSQQNPQQNLLKRAQDQLDPSLWGTHAKIIL